MRRPKFWFLIGLLGASCVVPDVEVVSSDDDDTMGSSGKSNNPSEDGGAPGEPPGPGSSGSTGESGSGASGGSGPTPPAAFAVGKFCNDITVGGESITLTLSVGTNVNKVQFSAASGTCQPVSGQPCRLLPVGTQIPVTLLDGSNPIVTYPADIEDGASWIFVAYTDGQSVDFVGKSVTQAECEDGLDTPPAAQ